MRNTRDIFILAVFNSLLLILLFSLTAHALEDRFVKTRLEVDGALRGHIFGDLNGDGLDDIIVLHSKGTYPDRNKIASIFYHTPNGFQGKPDNNMVIPDSLVLADIGDVAGDENPELMFIGVNGVYYFRNENGFFDTSATELFKTETIILLPASSEIMHLNFVREAQGYDVPLLFIPRLGEMGIYQGTPGLRYREISSIKVEERASIREFYYVDEERGNNAFYFSHLFPKVYLKDLNEDGYDDIFLTDNRIVYIYTSDENGRFPEQPVQTINPKVLTDDEMDIGVSRAAISVVDINNDGIPDIKTSKLLGSIFSYSGELKIYYGKKGGSYSSTPDVVIPTESSNSAWIRQDFNGDGKLDVAITSLRLGAFGMIKMMVLNRLDMFLRVYLQRNNSFQAEPDYEKKITHKVDLFGGYIDIGAVNFSCDVNGDGVG
ncbi:MAG: hypothetical protein GF307_07630, partial [candidate division Zixibacteria bacterium]|nr:hypothetical protein [candidate division Zixibacteria bacterium]